MGNSISTTHEWRKIEEFEVGDCIHRWGDDLLITKVERTIPYIRLTYTETDGTSVTNLYKIGGEYIARKRDIPLDAVDEEAQKALFANMLPPITYSNSETPEQIATRVIRHAEEWTN